VRQKIIFIFSLIIDKMDSCRFCGHELNRIFADLGEAPLSNSFISKEQLNLPEEKFPLKVFVCDQCFLVQIGELKNAREIFNESYAYFSSYSSTWLDHCRNYTDMIVDRLGLDESNRVIEIASNDGYLLQFFRQKNIPVLGIEPTANTAAAAIEKGIDTNINYFTTSFAKELAASGISADLLIGNNVLAHVPDINDFVNAMKILLAKEGTITMEFPHLLQLVRQNQFDTIYHEHFSYFSFHSVIKIFEAHGLTIFDAEELQTHNS
jgi:2-polyprenyl-3-methyl-5-hydroxy-6-metoxy-1,4-benzoquinol methylase